MNGVAGYLTAGLIGLFVGWAELCSRYKDSIWRSVTQPASIAYLLINGGASTLALALVRTFGWTFGQPGVSSDVLQVLVAGLGAVALFRTKLFTSAEKDAKIDYSPSRLLEQLLSVCDRQVDRDQASWRSRQVSRIMEDVEFGRAIGALPSYALALLQNPSRDDQETLAKDIGALAKDSVTSNRAKSLLLGVVVVRVTGIELLRDAVAGLGAEIQRPADQASSRELEDSSSGTTISLDS